MAPAKSSAPATGVIGAGHGETTTVGAAQITGVNRSGAIVIESNSVAFGAAQRPGGASSTRVEATGGAQQAAGDAAFRSTDGRADGMRSITLPGGRMLP